MKKFLLLLLLCAIAMPVWAQEEQEITPETVIYIQDGDVIRVMTVADVQDELDTYDKEMVSEYKAYEDNDGNMIIPMHPDVINSLREQQELEAYEEEYETRGESFSKEYKKEWGDKSLFAAYIDAAMSISGDEKTRELHAHFYAGGSVFNKDVRIVTFEANMQNNSYSPSASASFKVLGLCDWSWSQDLHKKYETPTYTIFEYKWIFMVGPVPVEVTAGLTGKVWIDLGLGLSSDGFGIMGFAIPGAEINGKCSAGVTVVIATIKVQGEITFINISMPFVAQVFYMPNLGVRLRLRIDLDLEALKGAIKIIVEINLFIKKKSWSKTLWDWEGIKTQTTLYDKQFPTD